MYHCIILYHALISYSFVEPVGRKWNRSASLSSSSWGPRLGRTCFRVRLGTSLGFETLLILRGEDDLKIQVPGTQTCIGVSRYLHLCSPMCFMLWTQSGEDQMNFLVQKRLPSSKITPKGLQKKMNTVDVISDLCHKLPGPGWHDAATRAKTRLSEKVGQAVMTLSPSKGIQNPKPRLAVFKLPWRESKMAGPSPNLQHHTLSPKLQRLTDASSKVLHGKKPWQPSKSWSFYGSETCLRIVHGAAWQGHSWHYTSSQVQCAAWGRRNKTNQPKHFLQFHTISARYAYPFHRHWIFNYHFTVVDAKSSPTGVHTHSMRSTVSKRRSCTEQHGRVAKWSNRRSTEGQLNLVASQITDVNMRKSHHCCFTSFQGT